MSPMYERIGPAIPLKVCIYMEKGTDRDIQYTVDLESIQIPYTTPHKKEKKINPK